MTGVKEAVENLNLVLKLQYLRIRMDSETWFEVSGFTLHSMGQIPRFKKVEEGFTDLAALCCKAKKVVFVGDCTDFEEWIRTEMEKLKAGKMHDPAE